MAERKLSVILTGAAKLGKMVVDADGAFGKLGGAAKRAGKVVVGAFAAAGAAAGAAVTKGVLDALEAGSINAHLQGSLGLSDADAAAAGAAAGDVWASGFGSSLGEVSAATEAVLGSLGEFGVGASSAELGELTTQAIALSDVFGTDVATAAATAGGMIRNGLAADGEAAFDLLTASLQKMPVAIRDELFDATQEYGKHFATLGMSGEEAMGLLVAASSDGTIAVDKVGDALKELTIRGADMSAASVEAYQAAGLSAEDMAAKLLAGGDTARGALDEIVSGLRGMDDPVAQANAAIALMGTPLEDLGTDQIPAFLDALASGDSAIGDFAGAADKLAGTLDTPAKKFESFKRKALQGISESAAKYALPAIEEVGDWIGDRLPGWIDKGQDALDGLADWWSKHGPAILDTVETTFEGAKAAFDVLASAWQEQWPRIQSIISTAVTTIQTVVSSAVTILTELWRRFGDDILRFVQNVWPAIQSVIEGALAIISGIFQTFAALLTGDWSAVWDGLATVVSGAWDVITGVIDGALAAVELVIGSAWEAVTGIFDSAWGGIASALAAVWDGIKTTISEGVADALGFFTSMPQKILETVSSVGTAAKAVGSAMIEKIGEGLTGVIDFVGDMGKAIANAAIDFVNSKIIDSINSALEFDFKVKGVGFSINPPDIPHIPRLHSGGVVPGGASDEVLRILQGGEVVLDRGTVARLAAGQSASSSARGGDTYVVINVEGSVQTERDLVDAFWEGVVRRGLIQGGMGR